MRVYPPFLELYLFDKISKTFLAVTLLCSLEINFLVFCRFCFLPKVIILSACGFKNFAFGKVVLICSYFINEFNIFFNNAFLCSEVLFSFLFANPCLIII